MGDDMSEINPVDFGKLVGAVEVLTIEVTALRKDVKCLQSQLTTGRGMIAGMLLAAGGIGAGATHLLERVFK